MKAYVSLALLLSFAFCAKKDPNNTTFLSNSTVNTQENTTTTVSTTTLASITTPAPTITSTPAPTTTTVNATTKILTTITGDTSSTSSSPATVNATTQILTTMTVNATTKILTTITGDTSSTSSSSATDNTTLTSATTGTSSSTAPPTTTRLPVTTAPPATTESITGTSSNSTVGTSSSTTPPTTTRLPVTTAPPATTEAPLPCANKPCGGSAKCINLFQGYTCQCPYGYYHTTSGCQEGKVFPGTFTVNIPYTVSMTNENSLEYWYLYRNVTDFFNTTFTNGTGFGETIIVNVKQSSAKSKIQNKAETSETNVIVRNMFEVTTELNASEVASLIRQAMKGNSNFNNDSYQELSQCDIYGCDEATTICKGTDDVTCECKPGFSKKNAEEKTCSNCDSTCSEEKHMHCVAGTNGAPVCQCLPNFKDKDGNCMACDVGYSGVNCSNNSLLILIIVAVLCGALILGLAAGLIFTSLRANKRQKNPERRHLLTEEYSDKRETPGHISAINSAANDKIFPTIQTSNAGQENRGFEISNPYEMGPPTRKLPERDYDDDEYEMSSKGDGFRLQRRY